MRVGPGCYGAVNTGQASFHTIVSFISKDHPVSAAKAAEWAADIIAGIPVMLYSGISLFMGKPSGYSLSGGLLMSYGILSAGLIPYLFVQSDFTGKIPGAADIIVLSIMAALFIVPAVIFMFNVTKNRANLN